MSTPYDLRIDAPSARPLLSWKPGGGSTWQVHARVAGVAMPVAIVSQHLFVAWPLRALTSGETVEWQVGDSHWHTFEVSLLDEDWTASWISPAESHTPPLGQRPAYALRGGFAVTGEVSRARLYSTALGVYEAFVNGDRAGDAELAPRATSYADTLYPQATDVTAALRAGANTLEVLLSDGWYRGMNGTGANPEHGARHRGPGGTARALHRRQHPARPVRQRLDLAAQRHHRRGPDERADHRLRLHRPRTGAGARRRRHRAAGRLVSRPTGPARSTAAPARGAPARQRFLDRRLGQNAAGWIRLSDLGPAGTRTVIDHGEHLDPTGDLTTSHLDSAKPGQPPVPFVQRDQVVSSGTPGEVFEPRHTLHGFRYARISRGDVPLDPASIVMQVVHTDLRRTAAFSCGDDDVNRLHEVADWSFRGNAVDIPTDCPTRERLGWTGDYQVFAPTAARLYDVDGFSRKWLRSVRDDQLDDGRIVNTSPDHARLKVIDNPEADHITGSAGWGDAIVAVPWVLYETYGDR